MPAVVKVVNCQFVNDQCVKYGGRVYAKDGGVGSSVTLINCLFNGELATDSTASDGGGVWLEGINLTMKDCTVVHCNAGHGEGGGLVTYPTGSGTVTNCLFFENHAGGFADSDDIGDNTSMTISYCAMQVLPTGGGDYSVGNIVFGTGETPHFVNDSLGNFHLTCGSRCVNTGHNSDVPDDTEFDVDENPSTSGPFDLDIMDRIVGSPSGVVDMGAYEVPASEIDICAADINANGVVNIDDLLAVIMTWGTCSDPYSCPTDCSPQPCGNDTVDIEDLLYVINHWGLNCPTQDYGNVGSLSSVEDYMDAASDNFTPYSTEWNDFVNKCVQGLCEARIIDCD